MAKMANESQSKMAHNTNTTKSFISSIVHPVVKRQPTKITFEHGEQIVDDYTWLENTTSSEVKDFESKQNKLTFDYLKQCPCIKEIKTTLSSMSNFRTMSCPSEDAETGNLFFFMKKENEDHEKLSMVISSIYLQKGRKRKPELFLATNQILPDSSRTKCTLCMYSVSPNGKIVAYAYSMKYSNWLYIRFKEVDTGKDYPEVLTNVCHSDISWTRGDENRSGFIGIIYSAKDFSDSIFLQCYLDPNTSNDHKIVFHEIGTTQQDDIVFVEFPENAGLTVQAQISDCGDMIFVTAQEDLRSRAYTHYFYGDLAPTIKNDYEITALLFHLLEGPNLDLQYITNQNCITYFRTNLRARNFRVVKTNLLHNDALTKDLWETIIPNDPTKLLDCAVCVSRNYLMVSYIEHACHKLQLHTLQTGDLLHKYDLPTGTITDYFGFRNCTNFYFTFSSFLIPDHIKYINIPSGRNCCTPSIRYKYRKIRTFNSDLTPHYDLHGYNMQRQFCYNPHDGEAVPIFLIYNKKIKKDGSSPCIIYGQGCFGVQVMPGFSVPKLSFLQCFEGIIAIVGVRGGGDHGIKWYADGTKLKKQTAYDDFIAASEFLIKRKYTSPSKLILEGQTFGGNLAAACLIQRPNLYAAVIIHEGLLDLMRYHCFPESLPYESEFGDPEAPIYFSKLAEISPYHHIPNKNAVPSFPAVMVIIGKHPSLSHSSNSFKFIAQLQYNLASKSTHHNPFLLCSKGCDEKSGKVGEKLKKIDERAYIYGFLVQTLGLHYTDKHSKIK